MTGKPKDRTDAAPPPQGGVLAVPIERFTLERHAAATDRVAVEAPLEVLLHHPALGQEPVSFGATMRTPGDDEALAAGLLFGESVVNDPTDVEAIETSTRRPNVVNVRLRAALTVDAQPAARRFSAGAACGVCGTTGLDAAIARAAASRIAPSAPIALSTLLELPPRMREAQARFGDTGGIHAAALFDRGGALLDVAEDVGRHNAFDKLVGRAWLAGGLPLADRIVLLSGRASFELVQKALRAGVSILAAIGAPSSLAVHLAGSTGLTLIGFLRERHCNVYAHPERLSGPTLPTAVTPDAR